MKPEWGKPEVVWYNILENQLFTFPYWAIPHSKNSPIVGTTDEIIWMWLGEL